jgi:hypothetical protein
VQWKFNILIIRWNRIVIGAPNNEENGRIQDMFVYTNIERGFDQLGEDIAVRFEDQKRRQYPYRQMETVLRLEHK